MQPSSIDLFDDDAQDIRSQYREFCERLEQLSHWNQELRRRAYDEDERLPRLYGTDFMPYASTTAVRAEIKKQFDDWSMALFSQSQLMREVRHYDAKHDALGMHVFLELTQLNAQLARPALLLERENLATIDPDMLTEGGDGYDSLFSLQRTKHPLWVQALNSFECPAPKMGPGGVVAEDDGEDGDRVRIAEVQERMKQLWVTPILKAKQSQVRLIILFLTQQLRQLPTRNAALIAEYRRVYNLTWVRVAALTNQSCSADELDEPDMRQPLADKQYAFNRSFAMFCYFYLSEVQRCFFHHDLLRARPPIRGFGDGSLIADHVFRWLSRVVDTYAADAFEDLYTTRAVPEGYHFVGDDDWFKFAYPTNVHSRGACIAEIRPHFYRAYYSEANLSKGIVMAKAKHGDYMATLFVLHALHEYLRIQTPRVSWLSGCVVDGTDGIEQSVYLLKNRLCPVLIQVVSFFWVYCPGDPERRTGATVHVCDNVYEAIGVWFWVLHTQFGDRLYDVDMSCYMREALPPPGAAAAAALEDAQLELRGLADAMNDFEI